MISELESIIKSLTIELSTAKLQFMKEREQLRIVNADKQLTKGRKEKEKQRIQTVRAEQERQTLQQNLERIKLESEQMEKQYREMIRTREEEFEVKINAERVENQSAMDKKVKDMRKILQVGFEEESEALQEINGLQQELRKVMKKVTQWRSAIRKLKSWKEL